MIKKLQFGFLIVALSLFLGVGAVAHAEDITFPNDTTFTLTGPSINLTIAAGSTATAPVIVDATTLTVTGPVSGSFILISPNRYSLTNSLGLGQSCNGSQNSVTVGTGQTVTFTPTTVVCTQVGGSGGLTSGTGSTTSGGSSSSGSSSSSSTSSTTTTSTTSTGSAPISFTVTSTTPASVSIPGCMSNIGFSTVNGMSCATNTTITVGGSTTMMYNFGTVTLKNGSRGAAVMELQRFLNAKLNLGLVIDGKLGPKTILVIKKWQKDHGLVSDGLIGAKTKAMMNAEAGTN